MFLPSIKLVAYAVIALFFMLSALFIILVIHKIYANRSQASIEQLKRKIQPPIFQNLFGEAEDSLKYFKKKRLFDDAILELLKEMNNQFDLNLLNITQSKAFEKYIIPAIEKRLRARRWSKRMNTLYLIESLGPAASWINLWQVYHRKHISRQDQYIILRINAQVNERLGNIVWKALTTPHPKVRYGFSVVPRPITNWVIPRLLPKRLIDVFMANNLGLKYKTDKKSEKNL